MDVLNSIKLAIAAWRAIPNKCLTWFQNRDGGLGFVGTGGTEGVGVSLSVSLLTLVTFDIGSAYPKIVLKIGRESRLNGLIVMAPFIPSR